MIEEKKLNTTFESSFRELDRKKNLDLEKISKKSPAEPGYNEYQAKVNAKKKEYESLQNEMHKNHTRELDALNKKYLSEHDTIFYDYSEDIQKYLSH